MDRRGLCIALDITDVIVSVSTPNEYTELTECSAEGNDIAN